MKGARPRSVVQLVFLAISILIGVRFGMFVNYIAAQPGARAVSRPPGVEAFLPISSFMGFVHMLRTRTLNTVHPAGLVIFTLIVVLTFLARRGFCSWVCPVGTVSEYAHKAGRKIMGGNFSLPRWADAPLRAIKYIILVFFVAAILLMPRDAMKEFIESPYNRMADVKMYLFFEHISGTALYVIAALLVLSMLVKNFWCRYLCPYGALLGLLSMDSPTAVRRNPDVCISCGECTKACPNRIDVQNATNVKSVECMACYGCVNACPTKDALGVHFAWRKKAVSAFTYGAIIIGAFFVSFAAARLFHYWQTDTTVDLYRHLYSIVDQLTH